MRGDAVDETVEDPLQRIFRIHDRQATDVAAILLTGISDPVLEVSVLLHVLIGLIGSFDIGADVAAGGIPDGQQTADVGVLVPRLVDGEVGLGDAEPLQRGRRIVVEELARPGVEIHQLDELSGGRNRRRWDQRAKGQEQHVVEGDDEIRLRLEQFADRMVRRQIVEHRHHQAAVTMCH